MARHNELNPLTIPPRCAFVLDQHQRCIGGFDHWEDVTGERYHFPNQYRNRVVPGRPFVYYRGVRRRGGELGTPEYFGTGRVGQVWRDNRISVSEPKRNWRWFCEIEDYRAFALPVPAKLDDEYLESISPNQWGVAVRDLPVGTFERILDLAGVGSTGSSTSTDAPPAMPDLEHVTPQTVGEEEHLFVVAAGAAEPLSLSRLREAPLRRSRFSRAVGERAERVVLQFLRQKLDEAEADTLRWVAAQGETPGWDIEYVNSTDTLVAVEVKGTQGPRFLSVDLTKNEWDAARALRDRYWLYLVASCVSMEPRIEPVRDPAGLADRGVLMATPNRWRIEFGRSASD